MYIYSIGPSILLCILTTTLNILVVKFYWKIKLTVVPRLYTLIASLDIVSATAIIYFYVVSLLHQIDLINFRNYADVNMMILTFLGQISNRCSVFCNLVLAVSRTVMILRPFCQINIVAVKLKCSLYIVPLIILYGLNVYQFYSDYGNEISQSGFLLGAGLASCMQQISATQTGEMFYIIWILPDLVAFIIPVTIVIITCIIQVISLQRSSQK